jgi:hypothetical protein
MYLPTFKDHYDMKFKIKKQDSTDELLTETEVSDLKEELELYKTNTHERDAWIRFRDDGHKYFIDYDHSNQYSSRGLISTTAFVKKNFSEFNPKQVIQKMRSSHSKLLTSKYAGMSDIEIEASWVENGQIQSDLGTRMHKCIEYFYNNVEQVIQSTMNSEWSMFEQFRSDFEKPLRLVPYRTEHVVYTDESIALTGSIDMVFVDMMRMEEKKADPNVLYVKIVDWKRSRRIVKKWLYGKKKYGTGATSDLLDINFIHYTLQLNVYRHIYEKYYQNSTFRGKTYKNIQVTSMHLGVFHPEQMKYIVEEIGDESGIIQKLLYERQRALVNTSTGKRDRESTPCDILPHKRICVDSH